MTNSIRRIYISKRKKITPEFIKEAGVSVLNIFKDSFLDNYRNFMTYIPVKNEAPVNKISQYLLDQGKTVSVPVTENDDSLTPVLFSDFNNTVLGKYKIPVPAEMVRTDILDIEVILVPGLVFDTNGSRMGYGKGCYDRFLNDSKLMKVGVCYEFQIHSQKLQMEKHDVCMNCLLTEKAFYEV